MQCNVGLRPCEIQGGETMHCLHAIDILLWVLYSFFRHGHAILQPWLVAVAYLVFADNPELRGLCRAYALHMTSGDHSIDLRRSYCFSRITEHVICIGTLRPRQGSEYLKFSMIWWYAAQDTSILGQRFSSVRSMLLLEAPLTSYWHNKLQDV